MTALKASDIKSGLRNHGPLGWTEIIGIKKMNSVGGRVGSSTVGYRWLVYPQSDLDLVTPADSGEVETLPEAKQAAADALNAINSPAPSSYNDPNDPFAGLPGN